MMFYRFQSIKRNIAHIDGNIRETPNTYHRFDQRYQARESELPLILCLERESFELIPDIGLNTKLFINPCQANVE